MLLDCCGGISRALGFERVMIEIADPDSDQLRLRASLGWDDGPPGGHELARRRGQALRPRLRDRGLLPAGRPTRRWRASAPRPAATSRSATAQGPLGVGPPLADRAAHPRRRAHRRLGVARRPVRPPPPHPARSCGSCGPSPTRRWPPSATPPTSTSSRSWPGSTASPARCNRRAFLERLDLELQRARRSNDRGHARAVRPRPVQGAQRRPRPPGRRRRAAQLHPDPRAQRAASDAVGPRRRRRVRADPRRRRLRGRAPPSSTASPPRSRRSRPRWARCERATARPAAPTTAWTRDELVAAADRAALRPQAPAAHRHPHIPLVDGDRVTAARQT